MFATEVFLRSMQSLAKVVAMTTVFDLVRIQRKVVE